MRTEGQIRHQLKQVLYRHLKKRLKANFRKKPQTCLHNSLVPECDVYVCGLRKRGRPRSILCDPRVEECRRKAKRCPLWEPKQPKEEIKAAFKELIDSKNEGQIAYNCPDAAALMWVLDEWGSDFSVGSIGDDGDE